MVKITFLKEAALTLEECLNELESVFDPPVITAVKNTLAFRHKIKSDILASFLKCVRILSLLNASFSLLEKGFIQEVYILCRAIDEASEDITFLALPQGVTGTSSKQAEFLKEFFQEEFGDYGDTNSLVHRHRVPRKKIQAAMSHVLPEENERSHFKKIANVIMATFSGFVHGPYVFIMELYGGTPPHYHMRGMLNTVRIKECEENFFNYIFRAALSINAVAHRLNRQDIAKKVGNLIIKLDPSAKIYFQ